MTVDLTLKQIEHKPLRCILVTGKAGSGKTTWANALITGLCEQQHLNVMLMDDCEMGEASRAVISSNIPREDYDNTAIDLLVQVITNGGPLIATDLTGYVEGIKLPASYQWIDKEWVQCQR